MRPGETEIWRIANEGADILYDLQLPGYTFTVVGQDGYPVAKVTKTSELDLPPGKRWDVLVTARTHLGATWLRTLRIDNGPQGDIYPRTNELKLVVSGAPGHTVAAPTGALKDASPSLAGAKIAKYRQVILSEDASGLVMYINGKQFNPNKSIFSTPAVLGTIEQWTVYNTSGEVHVFHTHTDHFEVMSINGVPQPFTGLQDTVDVPYAAHGEPGEVVIRIHFTDFTGKVMFHCHIAAHEDAGMMSFINVVDAPPAATQT
jgi:FtsP/CotA-like multicopper oxidase with cupredoxin domain